jgi:hypothetical protein
MARSAQTLRRKAEDAIVLAAGIAIEATAPRELWFAGDSIPVDVRVYNRGRLSVQVGTPVAGVTSAGGSTGAEISGASVLSPDSLARFAVEWRSSEVDQPWWLLTPRAGDMFSQPISGLSDNARQAAAFVVAPVGVEGIALNVRVPIVYRTADPVLGEVIRPVSIVPVLALTLDRSVEIAPVATNYDRAVTATVRSAIADIVTLPVSISVRVPTGLSAQPDPARLRLSAGGSGAVTFRVRGRLSPGTHRIAAEIGGPFSGRNGYQLIDYPHIRPQRIYREATIITRAVDVTVPAGVRVTYIPGVSDNVAPVLQQLGYAVTVVPADRLPGADLTAADVVVVGPRAFETSEALVANNPRLLEFVRLGGTMVVQYNQTPISRLGVLPYPITVGNDRVTEEDAPVRMLDPAAAVLTAPNRIAQSDFEGWVQERGLYMPRAFDPAWKAVLSTNDPGEQPIDGGILIARYGAGTYVYTTLAFFRQLPAGVPGATRLFVNLLAAGQQGRPVP